MFDVVGLIRSMSNGFLSTRPLNSAAPAKNSTAIPRRCRLDYHPEESEILASILWRHNYLHLQRSIRVSLDLDPFP
ncbi:hypothetical protein AKJ16_DCAP19653, partial [Drosera capensis]